MSSGAPAAVLTAARGALGEDGAGADPPPQRSAGGGAERGGGGRNVRRATATEASTPRPASLGEPRGDVVQVQRHTVEQLADGAPRLPTLDVSVPQMVDQPVAVLARFDLPVPEQVIRFSRAALRSPWMAEQLVEVPVPSVLEVKIMAPFVDTAGRTWYWISTLDGRYTWCLAGYTAHPADPPGGDHRQPRAFFLFWARLRIFHGPLCLAVTCSVLVSLRSASVVFFGETASGFVSVCSASWSDIEYMFLPVYGGFCTRILRSILVLLSLLPCTAHCLVFSGACYASVTER